MLYLVSFGTKGALIENIRFSKFSLLLCSMDKLTLHAWHRFEGEQLCKV